MERAAASSGASRGVRRCILVLGGYLLLCLLPLGVAMLGPRPIAQGFWIELGIAVGFIGLGMMGVQFGLTARFEGLSRRLGQDTLLRFHRRIGVLAAVFVFAHPVILIAAESGYASFFDPRVNFLRAVALAMVNAALVALILLSVMRAKLGLKYEWWRLTHGALAALIMVIALAHIMKVELYISTYLKKGLVASLIVVPLVLLGYVRVVRPLRLKKRPYRVVEVRRERERVWTVAMEPVGDHRLRFKAGQFAWVTFGDTPLSLGEHPFTIASSAVHPERLEFTIKELGDFTSTIGLVPVGSTAFVDGPAGNYVVPDDAAGVVLVAGGIGVTPAISILRTLCDRADRRPMILIYANETLEKAVFADELGSISEAMGLRVVHVPERPPSGWTGPSGYITQAMLEQQVPDAAGREWHYFVCGPDPMMDAVETALINMGVPPDRMRSERFNIV